MRTLLVLAALLLSAPAFALDCNGGKLVIGADGTACHPLSQEDLRQQAIDAAKAPQDRAEMQAQIEAQRARTPEKLEEQIEALRAEVEKLKGER